MSEVSDLAILVRANTPLIALETREESRVIDTFRHVVARVLRPLYRWSLTDGLKRLDLDGQDEDEPAPDTTQTLIAMKGHRERGICTNDLTIQREVVEARVLAALEERFLQGPAFDEFCRMFWSMENEVRMQRRANVVALERQLVQVRKEIEQVIDAVTKGWATPSFVCGWTASRRANRRS